MTLGPTKAARDLAPGDVVMWKNVAREVSSVSHLAGHPEQEWIVHFVGGRWCTTGERYRFELASRPKGAMVEKQLTGILQDTSCSDCLRDADELLLTVYTDGAVELATRPAGSPGSWGPPIELRPIPAAATSDNQGVWP